MDEIKVQLSDDAVRWFEQNYRYTEWDADEFARDQGWSGFDFVVGSDGEPLVVPGEYVFGHLCSHLLDASNAEAAATIMGEAAPGKASEFHGVLAYDYADEAAREATERIGASLAGYPVLNDEDFDQREREAAISTLTDCCDVPAEIAGDVAAALSDDGQSLCTDCSIWDLGRIMDRLGYRECAECDGWIKTSHDEPLHYDCAKAHEEPDCECVSRLIDTHRHNEVVTTWADVRETLRGCEYCYSQVLPYGKTA
ncbi:hypothetical protein SAMN05421805_10653 [Saccharopolyspora antimicrobica]|uniref:Uncharacterized protein n=1 Tax=Saccharopolyspora antimicrobica TaxID=455193 RepID=A0A1I5AYS8_9PSEU|nr:hypothetical protein [Saccharopolyspora antimicrobica]RKT86412.1 hypothetical protein ATL45_4779 [Saccharopolyspora antimicrobica]SFN67618.1 hypothetical protein SAMN05421805_10653 [Saccharopolyspora antimicrobica]